MQWHFLAAFLATAAFLQGAAIHLKTRTIEPRPDRGDYRGQPLKRRAPGKSHYLLQFAGPINQDQLDDLANRGATVTSAIPDSAVMVAAGDDFTPEELGVEWAGRLRPQDKLSASLDALASDQPAVLLVEFHSDVDMAGARDLVLEAGLSIVENSTLLGNQLLVSGGLSAVAALTGWDEVAYVFPASDDLKTGNDVIACAGALTNQGRVAQYVQVGHGWTQGGANGAQLAYSFGDMTEKVPSLTAQAEILRAFQEWSKHANVQFAPGSDPTAARTVRVLFARGDHGDPYPFDGSGGTLAHTFYPSPPNPEPLAGDMHFDADENWHAGGANIDIYTVALHETGHALGLGHSDQPGAVMYPYYRLGAVLSPDDIAGIQGLYGASDGSAPSVPRVPVTPVTLTLVVRNPAAASLETTASWIPLAGVVSDGTGETKVTWQTDHAASGVAAGSASWTVDSVPLAMGMNTITLTATDAAHHTASATLSAMRKAPPAPDTAPPSLAITSPSFTVVSTSSASITLHGTASDNVGVVKVTWQDALGGATGTASGTTAWTAEVPLNPGTNTLVVKAFDAAGNSSWRSLTAIRH